VLAETAPEVLRPAWVMPGGADGPGPDGRGEMEQAHRARQALAGEGASARRLAAPWSMLAITAAGNVRGKP